MCSGRGACGARRGCIVREDLGVVGEEKCVVVAEDFVVIEEPN